MFIQHKLAEPQTTFCLSHFVTLIASSLIIRLSTEILIGLQNVNITETTKSIKTVDIEFVMKSQMLDDPHERPLFAVIYMLPVQSLGTVTCIAIKNLIYIIFKSCIIHHSLPIDILELYWH
jgi:hypothetical protein